MVKEKIGDERTHFPPPFTGEVLTADLVRGKRWGTA
jgi:hypothetical protein